MSCNGWNHPADCTCDFSGGYRGYVPPPEPRGFRWVSGEDYSNPNALCPKCKKLVYFVRPKHGGSVYFDELAPPWPKHPCMDTHLESTGSPQFQKAGWFPVKPNKIKREGSAYYVTVNSHEGVGVFKLPFSYSGGPIYRRGGFSGWFSFLDPNLSPVKIKIPPFYVGPKPPGFFNPLNINVREAPMDQVLLLLKGWKKAPENYWTNNRVNQIVSRLSTAAISGDIQSCIILANFYRQYPQPFPRITLWKDKARWWLRCAGRLGDKKAAKLAQKTKV